MEDKVKYSFYVVHCDVDDRKYVGCTSYSLDKRWGDHCSSIRTSARTPFHKEAKEIGLEHFSVELLAIEEHTRKSAVVREEEFISMYDSRENGFNDSWARKGSDNGNYGKPATNDNFTNPSKNPSTGRIQKTAKAVSIEGVVYPSTSHAGRALLLDRTLVSYRVRSKSAKFSEWFYITGKD